MTLASPQPETTLLAIGLLGLFYALGLGLGLVTWSWCRLPPRYLGPLTAASATLAAYVLFWVSYLAPRWRSTAVAVALLTSLAVAVVRLKPVGAGRLLLAREVWIGPLLGALVTGAYLSLLFFTHVGANFRFTWALSGDNIIPALVAVRIIEAHPQPTPPPPLWGQHRASERPPLQAAVVVALSPMTRGLIEGEYQIVGTLCQTQWVPVVLLLAAACGLRRRATVFVLVACICSGFFFANSVFTWPKLLSAWLFLLGVALLIEPDQGDRTASRRRVVVAVTSMTLALLAHPGALFSLLGLPVLLGRKGCARVWRTRGLMVGALLAGLLVAPWVAYQQLVDPPMNRIIKLHLAGTEEPEHEGVLRVMRTRYAERSVARHVWSRVENVGAQFWSTEDFLVPDVWAWAQREQFFHHAATLGLAAIGWLVVLWRWRAARSPRNSDHAVTALARYSLATLAIWILPLFEGGAAIIHSGSYANVALLFLVGAVGLSQLSPWLGNALLTGHVAIWAIVWVAPHVAPVARTVVQFAPGELIAGVLYLACALALLAWLPVASSETAAGGGEALEGA